MAMKYIHSHVHTEIVDNSFYTTTVEGGTVGFFPIFSEKGKENEIVNIDTGVNGFVNTYGADASKFGQAHLNVIQWLQGGGTAAVMRLLPEDASYASAAIIVNVDSYIPEYKVTVKVNVDNKNGVKINTSNVIGIFEGFAIEDSTIKEIKSVIRNSNGVYDENKLARLFANGRGNVAEDPYDLSEDWMRNNGHSVSDEDGEVEESTNLLPVKTYVNYGLVRDFARYFGKGTESIAPEMIRTLIENCGLTSFVVPTDDGAAQDSDIVINTDVETGEKTYGIVPRKFALTIKENGRELSFGEVTSEDVFIKSHTETLYISDGIDDYGDPTIKNEESAKREVTVYEVEGFELNEDNDELFKKYYRKVTGDSNLDGVEDTYFEEVRVLTKNPFLELHKIALASDSITKAELKAGLFEKPEAYNVYIDFTKTIVNAKDEKNEVTEIENDIYTENQYLSSFLTFKVEDTACEAAYFLDGYPIEVYSENVIIGTSVFKVWNARITVTDSDGVTTSYPLFKSDVTNKKMDGISDETVATTKKFWIPKFSQEKYIYKALSALVHYSGRWNELNFSHTQKIRGFKTNGHFYNKGGDNYKLVDSKTGRYEENPAKIYKYNSVTKVIDKVDEGTDGAKDRVAAVIDEILDAYPDYGWCEDSLNLVNPILWYNDQSKIFICLKDVNFEALKGALYSGEKNFTRMDADQVTVELYSPSEKKSTSRDGIVEDIKSYVNTFNNNVSNLLAGKKKYPIGYFASQCKGDYYNNMKIYLELNNDLKDTYDFRLYNLTIYDMGGVQTKNIAGPFTVALDKDAIDNAGTSLYIKNIMNTYAEDCDVKFYDDVDANAFKKCAEDLASLFKLKHPLFTFDNAAVDPLFIPQVDENILSTGNPDYEFHSYFAITDDESIPEDQRTLRIQGSNNISTASTAILSNGFFLSNGSSGTLYDKRGNIIQSVYRNLLIKCFTGSTNPDVLDTINNEFDVVLDAKYPNTVKKAMAQFGEQLENSEGGVMVFLDTDNMDGQATGPKNSVDAAVKARRAFSIDSRSVAIFSQNTTAYDEYSSKEIPVSATYLLAYKIPHNDETNGIHTAFVGPRRGSVTLTGPVNWFPTEAEKEKLYKAQINYISRDPKRTAFDCQLTSQIATSALSNIPNVRVLYRIKRAVRKICDEYRFERNTGAIRNQMQGEINEYLRTWVKNGACSTCTATVSANDYQIKQKMAQVDISIVFVGFLERINVTLTVNG